MAALAGSSSSALAAILLLLIILHITCSEIEKISRQSVAVQIVYGCTCCLACNYLYRDRFFALFFLKTHLDNIRDYRSGAPIVTAGKIFT